MTELTGSTKTSSTESLHNEEPSLEVKFTINLILNNLFTTNIKELEFPSSLSSNERAYVRRLCELNDFIFETRGKGRKMNVFISKKSFKKSNSEQLLVQLNLKMSNIIEKNSFIELNQRDIDLLTPKIQKPRSDCLLDRYKSLFRLDIVQPAIPSYSCLPKDFPIANYKEQIMSYFATNRLLFIGGDSAIGKSNQIAQYILDFYQSIKKKCRVVFSLPFDIVAFSMASKLSRVRNESLGSTIGCHVYRNKKYCSDKSLITFCTHEILLKNISSREEETFFNSVTDIVLDEIHIRDRYLDFILILMREIFFKYSHIKLVFIGPGQMKEQIQKYFNQCNIFLIPSIYQGNTKEIFLNDILKLVNFSNGKETKIQMVGLLEKISNEKRKKIFFKNNLAQKSPFLEKNIDIDYMLELSFKDGIFFEELEKMVQQGKMNIDYLQKDFSITILISAVVNGRIDVVQNLLRMGANLNLISCNQMNAIDWAKRFSQIEILNLLESYRSASYFGNVDVLKLNSEIDESKKTYDLSLIKSFYQKLSENFNNLFDLLGKLINKILGSEKEASIMVYLPNISHITKLMKILKSKKAIKIFQIFEDISFEEYEKICQFKSQKIILTTHISEFLPVLDNVTVVIDTGLNQEIVNEETANSRTKKIVWISKQSFYDRARKINGQTNFKIYRLYSKEKAKSFLVQRVCEFLSYPLQEICLLSKQTIPFNISITDFISKGLDYPDFLQLRNSISNLKLINALDTWEDMSDLGVHLINLPIDLQYSKSIIYAILLKCLEPILVIVSTLSVGEPFITIQPNHTKYLNDCKKTLVNDCKSDHLLLYKIYLMWKKSFKDNNQKKFCSNFILNEHVLFQVEFQRIKLLYYLFNCGLIKSSSNINDLNKNSNNVNIIKACMVAGLYPNILKYENTGFVNNLWSDEYNDATWVLYDNENYINGNVQIVQRITFVSSILIAFFSGFNRFYSTDSNIIYKIDSFINFKMTPRDKDLFELLRKKFSSVLVKFINKLELDDEDQKIIELVVEFFDSNGRQILNFETDIETFDVIFKHLNNSSFMDTFYLDELSKIH